MFHKTISKILVLSVDFDNCIFNSFYRNRNSNNPLITANENFIQHVLKEIKFGNFNRVILMVGSNRQSKFIDDLNARKNESCFPALLRLCEEIKSRAKISCDVDRYLLADTYGNRASGENFTQAISKESNYHFSNFVWDEYKYSLAYAQMHKIASENPAADISYQFYDDRDDILNCLESFYIEHENFVPSNLTFIPYSYCGNELKHRMDGIRGKGIADSEFEENIKLMARCCGYDTERMHMGVHDDISANFYGNAIKKFENGRSLKIKDICFELAYEIKCIEKNAKYETGVWHDFMSSLNHLYKQIMKELKNQNQEKLPAAEEMLQGSVLRIACDTTKMLREFRDANIEYERYFNKDRQNELMNYIELYGHSMNYLKSSVQTISNAVYSMFYSPNRLTQSAYQLAEHLKPFLLADEVEFNHVESARKMSYVEF